MSIGIVRETYFKRQATRHDCLPSLLGDGENELKWCTVRKKCFVLGRLEQPRHEKIILYWSRGPTKKGPLSHVIFEYLSFNSQYRGHPYSLSGLSGQI
jgi:hypothetical protein